AIDGAPVLIGWTRTLPLSASTTNPDVGGRVILLTPVSPEPEYVPPPNETGPSEFVVGLTNTTPFWNQRRYPPFGRRVYGPTAAPSCCAVVYSGYQVSQVV